jgi:LmbE family N-acetylglucosaminyl deacetylase
MRGASLGDIDSVLCLGAHSDDIEIGCGGTLLKLIAANPRMHVHWCVFSGSGVREAEATASAARFLAGAGDRTIEVLDFRDSFFPDQWAQIKAAVASLANRVQPDLIFTHRLEDRHQDHRVIAELSWCAFRDHLVWEYEIPKYEGDLGQPNVYAEIPGEICEAKIAAIVECFTSQRGKSWFDAELFRSLMRIRGSECNAASRYAEAFYARKTTIDFK